MKRFVLGLVAAAALLFVITPAKAQAQYYRPGYRVNIYGGYRPYPYYRPYYGPAYYPPPPAYYYPPPVYPAPVFAPGISFSFGRR